MDVYTDGGCRDNPGGIGAWAFIAVAAGREVHAARGSVESTTNNRTELMAVIEAMRWLRACGIAEAAILTDSGLTVRCGNRTWKRKKNLDLWDEFDAVRRRGYKLLWIRGHSGNRWNNAADAACTIAMRELAVAQMLAS